MASNLSSIGFDFGDAEDFQAQMLARAAEAAERVGCGAGDYSIWRSSTGAQIWFHVRPFGTEDDARDIAGLTPFFEGESDVALEIVERIVRPGCNEFEGAFRGIVGGGDGHPVVFEAVDFAVHADRTLPLKCRARVVGFATMVRAFLPTGAHPTPIGEQKPATGDALLKGRVVEHHELVNEATGRAFHWLLVESLGATFDVVADPEAVEGEIVEGGAVEVGATMIGRLIGAKMASAENW